MKPRQLANVLIKILGISMCAHGVTPAIELFLQVTGTGFSFMTPGGMSSVMSANFPPFFLLSNFVPAGVGIILVVFSRTIATAFFNDEE